MRHAATLLLCTLACLAATDAMAQRKLYRCGNTYQDIPCANAQEGKVISNQQATSAPAARQSHPECIERGRRAQQIIWAKEAGKTADEQIASARSADEKTLIADAYARRGSSETIRQAIETDCMSERERSTQAAELRARADALEGRSKPTATSAPAATSRPPAIMPRDTDNKQMCAHLKAEIDKLRAQQRSGGSSDTMEMLNEMRRQFERDAQTAGC